MRFPFPYYLGANLLNRRKTELLMHEKTNTVLFICTVVFFLYSTPLKTLLHSYPNYMVAVWPVKKKFNKISFSNSLKTALDFGIIFSSSDLNLGLKVIRRQK